MPRFIRLSHPSYFFQICKTGYKPVPAVISGVEINYWT